MDNSAQFFRYSHWAMVLLSVSVIGCAKREVVMDASVDRAMNAPMVTVAEPMAAMPMTSNVATNSRIAVTFNKDIDPATVSESTFKVACPDGKAIEGFVTYSSSSRMASFTPNASLPAGTICTAAIVKGVQDTTGNGLEKAFIWMFMTGQM